MNSRQSVSLCFVIVSFIAPLVLAAEIETFLVGEMAQLELLEDRVRLSKHEIVYSDGTNHPLEEKSGKVLLVNLWVRWCVPCKTEMVDFANLQRALGGDRFEVIALPMEKRTVAKVKEILKNWGAGSLEPYGNDPQALARVLRDEGMFTGDEIHFTYPTTYLVSKKGAILAVHEGLLQWNTAEARALITALMSDKVEERPESHPQSVR